MFLLDTNVVSEFRKINAGKGDPRVRLWASTVEASSLFLSVVTIFELEVGTQSLERYDSTQGRVLRSFLENTVLSAFSGRILGVDIAVARRCALLHVPDPKSELDSLIAATALVHRMTVVTRNVHDFARMDVPLFNPWQDEAE